MEFQFFGVVQHQVSKKFTPLFHGISIFWSGTTARVKKVFCIISSELEVENKGTEKEIQSIFGKLPLIDYMAWIGKTDAGEQRL
jgi:hypothetical protein